MALTGIPAQALAFMAISAEAGKNSINGKGNTMADRPSIIRDQGLSFSNLGNDGNWYVSDQQTDAYGNIRSGPTGARAQTDAEYLASGGRVLGENNLSYAGSQLGPNGMIAQGTQGGQLPMSDLNPNGGGAPPPGYSYGGFDGNMNHRTMPNGGGYNVGTRPTTYNGGMGDLGMPGGNMWQGGGQPGQSGPGRPGGSGGGAAFGGSAPSGPGGAPGFTGGNPYLPQMADAITQQTTQAFNRNVLPAIGSNAMAAGGYGGSRQGVIEANAMNDMGQNLTNSLAGLYGNAYNTGLQYDLGLRNNNLGFANLDRNISNDNNSWQMAGANFGLGIYDRQQRDNQMGINAGTNMQNTPQGYWNNFSQGANSLGQGYGTSSSNTNMPGSPMTGMLGGAQLGAGAANWWGNRPTANSPGGSNTGGFGTGYGYGENDFGAFL